MTDLDALSRLIAGMSPLPWFCREDVTGEHWHVFDNNDNIELLYVNPRDGASLVAAVNALPGMIEEMKTTRAALTGLVDELSRLRSSDSIRLEEREQWDRLEAAFNRACKALP